LRSSNPEEAARPGGRSSPGLTHPGLTRLADAENTANALESRFDLPDALRYGSAPCVPLGPRAQ